MGKSVYCLVFLLCVSLFIPCLSNADYLDNWHWRNPVPPYQKTNKLYNVAYENNLFIATGFNTILTSPDGRTWNESYSSNSEEYLYGATYGNGVYVAVGFDHANDRDLILRSSDGKTWTESDGGSMSPQWLKGVAYGNNSFVAVGGDGGFGTILDRN